MADQQYRHRLGKANMNKALEFFKLGFYRVILQMFLMCPRVLSPDSGIDFSQLEMYHICILEVENAHPLKPKTDFFSFRHGVTDFIMQQCCRMLSVCVKVHKPVEIGCMM